MDPVTHPKRVVLFRGEITPCWRIDICPTLYSISPSCKGNYNPNNTYRSPKFTYDSYGGPILYLVIFCCWTFLVHFEFTWTGELRFVVFVLMIFDVWINFWDEKSTTKSAMANHDFECDWLTILCQYWKIDSQFDHLFLASQKKTTRPGPTVLSHQIQNRHFVQADF